MYSSGRPEAVIALDRQGNAPELRNAVYQDEHQWILGELPAAQALLAEEEAACDAMVSSKRLYRRLPLCGNRVQSVAKPALCNVAKSEKQA